MEGNHLEWDLSFANQITAAAHSFSGSIEVDWGMVRRTIEAEEERLRRIEEERQRQRQRELNSYEHSLLQLAQAFN